MEAAVSVAVLTAIVIILLFGFVLLYGAPYLPALRQQIDAGLDLLDLEPGDTLLELGCGDGKVLLAAAGRGYRVVGVELNPLLALIAWLRTRRYGVKVRVYCGNFWDMEWPASDGVYVFLLERFMSRLDARMMAHGGKLASVAFAIPKRVVTAERHGVFLYEYGPTQPKPAGTK